MVEVGMPWFYHVAGALVRTLLFLFTNWQVKGRQNVPKGGALVVVANHLNLADPPILAASLSRKVVFMAKQELFRSWFVSYIIRSFGAFPVNRDKLDREALRQASKILTGDRALVLFPEGRRSRKAQLEPGLPGSALIALRNGAPVLPVGIVGTEKIKGAIWWLRRPRVTINIGRPFSLPPANGKLTKSELAAVTDSIMTHIAELLPVEYRGHYGGRMNGKRD